MFTIGITKGRWNTPPTALQQFKSDYDGNHLLCASRPSSVGIRATRIGLRDLCDNIHGIYRANDIGRLTTEMYPSHLSRRCDPPTRSREWRIARSSASRSTTSPPRDERAADAVSAGHSAADPRRRFNRQIVGPQFRAISRAASA